MYHKTDALKKHQRFILKTFNRENYEELKFKQRVKKKEYQKKKKKQEVLLAESSLVTSNVSIPPTTFKHRPTKHRSLRKTNNSLLKSPGKQNETIKPPANKFN